MKVGELAFTRQGRDVQEPCPAGNIGPQQPVLAQNRCQRDAELWK